MQVNLEPIKKSIYTLACESISPVFFINLEQRMKQYFNLFDFTQKSKLQNRNLAGLTVAMTMTQSRLFAILAGFLVGFICALYHGTCDSYFGGRPGLVSAGATVIVLIALMKSNGLGMFLQQ
jgi:hypothetical protein